MVKFMCRGKSRGEKEPHNGDVKRVHKTTVLGLTVRLRFVAIPIMEVKDILGLS